MFRNVVAALNESLDITMHLRPLAGHYEVEQSQGSNDIVQLFFLQTQALEAADFADVRPLFAPLMHAVGKEIFVTA